MPEASSTPRLAHPSASVLPWAPNFSLRSVGENGELLQCQPTLGARPNELRSPRSVVSTHRSAIDLVISGGEREPRVAAWLACETRKASPHRRARPREGPRTEARESPSARTRRRCRLSVTSRGMGVPRRLRPGLDRQPLRRARSDPAPSPTSREELTPFPRWPPANRRPRTPFRPRASRGP